MPHEDLNNTVRGHGAHSMFRDTLSQEVARWADLALTSGVPFSGPSVSEKRRHASLNDLSLYIMGRPLEDQRLAALSKIHLALGKGWDTPYKAVGEQATVLASFGHMGMDSDSSRALDELVCAGVDDVQRAMNDLRASVGTEKHEVRQQLDRYEGIEQQLEASREEAQQLSTALAGTVEELNKRTAQVEFLLALTGADEPDVPTESPKTKTTRKPARAAA
jgi:hypothetical protein